MLGETTWSDARVAELRRLWSEGFSTAEIGRRLDVSKNAVVGKAHRLDLPGRSSPIQSRPAERQHRVGSTPPPPRRPAGPMLPRLPRSQCASDALAATRERAPIQASVLSLNPRAGAARKPVQLSTSHTCCWPFDEPGSPRFRFCDHPIAANKPYCEAHCRAAYKRGA
jgi:GcrA cell cycle regulator